MKSGNPYVNDARTREARRRGYPARSVFKLEEIDRRFRVLRPGSSVLDLGCAPGSWSLYAARKVGGKGLVLGVDLQACEVASGGALTVVEGDATELAVEDISRLCGGRCPPFDVLLSDMAPRTTGVRVADHAASIELCETALALADRHLGPGGSLVVKAFDGPDLRGFEERLRPRFERVRRVRPKGTRARSVEVFLVALMRQKG